MRTVPSLARLATAPAQAETFRSLRKYPNYRLYWIGAFASNIGTWVQTVAQGWLVYQLTSSPFSLGLVSFASAVPVLALALIGGVLADRIERRTLMIGTQTAAMLQALVLGLLTLSGVVRFEHVLVLSFALGVINALNTPVRQGIISDLVPREDLQNAIGINSAQFQASRLIGPGIAGILLAAVGAGWCFLINAISFLAVIFSLTRLRLPPRTTRVRSLGFIGDALEGLRYVRQNRTISTLISLAAIPAFFGYPYTTLLPVFARDLLHVGAGGLGLLYSATGLGSLVGALGVASAGALRARGRLQLGALCTFGLCLIGFAASRFIGLSLLLLVVASASSMTYSALNQTFLQSLTADEFRGRVLSVLTLTTFGLIPLGSMLEGAIAQHFGASTAVGMGGLACCLVGGTILLTRPEVRDLA
jgi:MFS family permease